MRSSADLSPVLHSHRLAAALASLAAGLIAGFSSFPFLLWSSEDLASHGLLADDAWFYSVVARNWIELGRLTFDGDMSTNGFQPLWLLLQAWLQWAFPSADGTVLLSRASWLLFVLFGALTARYLARPEGSGAPIAGLVACTLLFVLPGFGGNVLRGLETPLMLALLMTWLLVFDATSRALDQARGPRLVALLAALSALLFLARTDLFWAAVIAFGWLLLRERRVSARVVLFAAVVVLLVLPYLLLNLWSEGALMPISGRVKLFYMHEFLTSLSAYLRSDEWTGPYRILDQSLGLAWLPLPIWLRYAAAGALLLVCWGLVLFWRGHPRIPLSLRLLALLTLCHLLFMHLAYAELRPYTAYYFAPTVLFVVLVLAAGSALVWDRVAASIRRPRGTFALSMAIGASLMLAAAALRHQGLAPRAYWQQRLALAGDIQRQVPEDQKVAAFWPGLLAEFSGRQVVPLDGVIGSNRYFEDHVRTGREMDYLRRRGVRFLAIYLTRPPDALLSGVEPRLANWSQLGALRLWEAREHVLGVVSARPTHVDGRGWYLLEL